MDDARSRRPNVSLVVESILRDVYFGCRLLWNNVTVTVVAVVSLSLAIGACTASFSLIDALILRPLPVRDPQRLINVVYRSPGNADDSPWFNYPLFERMRNASREHVQLFGMSFPSRRDAIFDEGDSQPEKVYAQWISGDALPILGVKPALGRLLTASDDLKPGQHPVAVISYDFWFDNRSGSRGRRWIRRIPTRHRALISSTAERRQERGTSTDVRTCRCCVVGATPGVARNTRRPDDGAEE